MSDKIIVIHTDGTKENFKPRFISQTIIDETGIEENLAERIQDRIAKKLYKLKQKEGLIEISTADIRAEVSSQLLKEGQFKAVEQNRKLGMSVSEFEDLLQNGCNDNANIGYSPEMIAKYAYDAVAKEYALLSMPKDCADAHINSYFHIHDLEYYNTRPNCFQYDLRFFAKNGLNIDGKGLMGSVAGPAKSFEVLLRHLSEAFMAGGTVFSGGQSYAFWNIFVAPYCRGLTYEEIKQQVQAFIFDANQSLVSRGGQILFTSLNVEFEVPEFLKNELAIGPGGVEIGVYGDYEQEAKLVLKALIEVLNEGDARGRPHRFPNVIFVIRDNTIDEYSGNVRLAHELVAKFPTIYFANCTKVINDLNRSFMGCRTLTRSDWTGNWEYDTLNVGNFMYNTINLPLIAIESKNFEDFKDTLIYYCELTKKSLLDRKEKIEDILYNKHMSDFLTQEDKDTHTPLYDISKNTFSIGYCGLNECIMELTDGKQDIVSNPELGQKIIQIIYDKCVDFKKETGLRFSCFASPAESTAHRFATYNKEKYPNAYVEGTKDYYYLTNSHHIPVNYDGNIINHIKNADAFHDLSTAGAILHLWLGETHPDPEALWSLNKKIVNTHTTFWAFSTIFTACNNCGYTINDYTDNCLICESNNVTSYDRCFAGDTIIYIKKDNIIKPITLKNFVENYQVTDWSVPVYDYKQQKYIWSKVKRGIKNPPEEMITINFNKGYTVTCTPNHKFYKFSRKIKSMYDTIPANELKIKSKISNHKCPIFIEDTTENFLGTFIGFVLGDGRVDRLRGASNISIQFRFQKKDKSDYLKFLLEKNNILYTFNDNLVNTNGKKLYSFYIGVENIGNEAYDIFNKTHGIKTRIIDYCYREELLLGVFAGLLNSDGSVYTESRNQLVVVTFNQVNDSILWLFYNLALLLGMNPTIQFIEKENKNQQTIGRISLHSKVMYDTLHNITLRSSFQSKLENGKCVFKARNLNGMSTVSQISEAPIQESYCIETEHEEHNTLFNGVLAQNCTGYYLPINGFNKGKQQEFKDRYRHKL